MTGTGPPAGFDYRCDVPCARARAASYSCVLRSIRPVRCECGHFVVKGGSKSTLLRSSREALEGATTEFSKASRKQAAIAGNSVTVAEAGLTFAGEDSTIYHTSAGRAAKRARLERLKLIVAEHDTKPAGAAEKPGAASGADIAGVGAKPTGIYEGVGAAAAAREDDEAALLARVVANLMPGQDVCRNCGRIVGVNSLGVRPHVMLARDINLGFYRLADGACTRLVQGDAVAARAEVRVARDVESDSDDARDAMAAPGGVASGRGARRGLTWCAQRSAAVPCAAGLSDTRLRRAQLVGWCPRYNHWQRGLRRARVRRRVWRCAALAHRAHEHGTRGTRKR